MKQKSYDAFERECKRLIKTLPLDDWIIEVGHTRDEESNWSARTYFNGTQKAARVVWNDNCVCKSTDVRVVYTAKYIALHEMLHILLHSLIFTAIEQKSMECSLVDAEEHALINKLVKLLEGKV